MISTFRDRSRSPGPRVGREKGDLRPEASDHPLSTSWWGEERPRREKKRVPSEQAEALQSTRKVSNNVLQVFCVDQLECPRNSPDALHSSLTYRTCFRKSHKP